uniref:Bifunctional inhibitor/plant lipid transfer protein/seed storage helical domain-containing protein n=1 Tax=Oryza meridionalis TaxID=40149 RepID=A0A0E0F3B0_9ORYZ
MASQTAPLLLLILMLAAAATGDASAAVQCGQVTQLMAPCMPYLAGAPGMTPYSCNSLDPRRAQPDGPDPTNRVAVCNCVKDAAAGFVAVDFKNLIILY